MPLVEMRDVWKSYGETGVLRELYLSAEDGELLVLLGPSGSGKTTALNLIAGIDSPDRGSVRVAGRELGGLDDRTLTTYRRDIVGYVFQFYNLLPTLTALENAALGLELQRRPLEPAREALAAVGLAGKENRFPAQLSGGEQQRVAIARALAKAPQVLVADEPTGNLDRANSGAIRQLLAELKGRTTIVVATHDEAHAEHADRTYRLVEGAAEPA